MKNIERKKAAILLSMVAAMAMISSITLTAFAMEENGDDLMTSRFREGFMGEPWRWGPRGGCYGAVEISEEYEANVLEIAENDLDVQGLLTDGYSITGVKPIMKSSIDGNGDVTTEATSAIVMLENEDTTSHASAWVDLESGSVTKIVILTRTVIDKT